jgi:cytochrome c-type biogenesis protein
LAGLPPGALVAAAAGTLSFLSPCVLPLVPVYLAFLTGVAGEGAAGEGAAGEHGAAEPGLWRG